MYRRILVAYDGSDGAKQALRTGIELAKRLRAELVSLTVEEPLPRYVATIGEVEEAKDDIDEHFRKLSTEAENLAWACNVTLRTVMRQGHEVRTILASVRQERANLLAIGSQGQSRVLEHILGSTALSVARLVPCSVYVARTRQALDAGGFRRIVCGVDGSPYGRLAFQAAVELAAAFGGTLVGATIREVSPVGRGEPTDDSYVQQLQGAAEEHARAAGVAFEGVTCTGHAAQWLCTLARERQADVIALGATGLEHPWSPTIGGTAMTVLDQAPCSILLTRPPQAALRVGDVMVRRVSSVTPETPLAQVVELLLRLGVKALPVVDAASRVLGIITGGDLLARGDLGLRLSLKRELDAATLGERLRDLAQGAKTARDVMSHRIYTVGDEADLAAAIRLMADHEVKRLPVVDRAGALVGIVSRVDILRALAALPAQDPHTDISAQTVGRTVGDLVTVSIPVVAPHALAEQVLLKVLESPLRRVVVSGEDGRVLGLISDRDLLQRASPDTRPWLLRLLTGERDPRRSREPVRKFTGPHGLLTASELMASPLFTVRPADSLTHAIRLMIQHQVKRLIVVNDTGRFLGLVDRREILRSLVA